MYEYPNFLCEVQEPGTDKEDRVEYAEAAAPFVEQGNVLDLPGLLVRRETQHDLDLAQHIFCLSFISCPYYYSGTQSLSCVSPLL